MAGSTSRVLGLPDTSAKRFADAEADTNSNADDQKDDEDLQNDSCPPAVTGHAVAGPVVALLGFRLLPPVLLPRPYCAVGVRECPASVCRL